MKENDYEKAASDFQKKYCSYYKGESVNEDVTQACWHSMYLGRKRLQEMKLELDIKIHENGVLGPQDKQVVRNVQTVCENGHKTTMITTPVSIRKIFSKNGKKIAEKTDYTAKAFCSVLECEKADKAQEVVCPHCGGIGTKESLIDGCDYCGAKFQIGEFERKISAFHVFHDYQQEMRQRNRKNGILMLVSILMFAVCGLFGMATGIFRDTMAVKVVLNRLGIVFAQISAVNFIVLVFARKWAEKHKVIRCRDSEALHVLNREYPEFHMEEFAEVLEYKLQTIHFANRDVEIQAFVKGNLNDVMQKYQTVVDCAMKGCRISSYSQDEKFHHISVEAETTLTYFENGRLREAEENLQLQMIKSRETKVSESLVSYSCPGCGSSMNLLNGGVCDYCGTRLKLEDYDWVIEGYTVTEMPPEKRWQKRTGVIMAIATTILLVFNIPLLKCAGYAGMKGMQNEGYSVYVFGNEFIPSLENYGYALLQSYSVSTWDSRSFYYEMVDSTTHVLEDYPEKLVNEDGFEIVSSEKDRIVLERERRFWFGILEVEIQKETSGYSITMRKK